MRVEARVRPGGAFSKLRTSRAALTSATIASATSPTTRPRASRPVRESPAVWRPPLHRRGDVAAPTGAARARARTAALTAPTPPPRTRARALPTAVAAAIGYSMNGHEQPQEVDHPARSAAAPTRRRRARCTRPSVSSCCTSRRRDAPSPSRTRNLALPRGRARELQVGQVRADDQQHERADRQQDASAARRAPTARRDAPGRAAASWPRARGSSAGIRCASAAASDATSPRACSIVTPGLEPREQYSGRALRLASHWRPPVSDACIVSGTNRSKRRPVIVPWKPLGRDADHRVAAGG